MPSCQPPARSDAACCGMRRAAASTRPQVSSAVENDGIEPPSRDDTTMPEARARVDVDVRHDADLADEREARQPVEQVGAHRGALAEQHQRVGVGEARGEHVGIRDVVGPHRDVVAGEERERRERPHGVLVVVEDGDLHRVDLRFAACL